MYLVSLRFFFLLLFRCKDSASQIVEIIWPLSTVAHRSDSSTGSKGVLPLRTFIQETLRRSRTSYSTLQVALYYLIKIKAHLPKYDLTKEQPRDQPHMRAMQCGRRMFLAALILASKYLQDRNYSARAWSKISGLNTSEINQNELMFLEAVNWKLHIPEPLFQRWTEIVLRLTPGAGGSPPIDGECWPTVLPKLTPQLDTIHIESWPSFPVFGAGFDLGLATESVVSRRMHSDSKLKGQGLVDSQNLSNTFEPTPRVDCRNSASLPALPRPLLPTPQMTPQSSSASTPAASLGAFSLKRPSIGAAMAQAQTLCMSRSSLDQRPPLALYTKAASYDSYPVVTRRSSLARSTSSVSSPESMVSDISTFSSRSSRSSSVSSIASGSCASSQSRLAVQATRRCANASFKEARKTMIIASPIDEGLTTEIYSSPDVFNGPAGSTPDLATFTLGTPVDHTASAHEAAQSLCALAQPSKKSHPTSDSSAVAEATVPVPAPALAPVGAVSENRCRKRGRTGSEDLQLQNRVRQIMGLESTKNDCSVAPDDCLPHSFLVSSPSKSMAAYQLSSFDPPVPISGHLGMKRACCGSEARKVGLSCGVRPKFLN